MKTAIFTVSLFNTYFKGDFFVGITGYAIKFACFSHGGDSFILVRKVNN